METYLVGGAVRDELLGHPATDRDWVVIGATAENLISQGYTQIGNTFPCFLHPETREEYALARTERKSSPGHQGFICDFGPHISLEEDLSRRDLTINAIARDTQGRYIDPYGGIADLKARILRHVSPAFSEDPLRVLRVARFAARFKHQGFRIHAKTLTLMSRIAAGGELQELSAERVWNELLRALGETTPSEFFAVLHRCGALRELLPELDSINPHVDAVRRCYDDPQITWAVLMHGLDPARVETLCRRLKTPREFLELSRLVATWHSRFENIPTMDSPALLDLIMAVDGIRRPARLNKFAAACAGATIAAQTPRRGVDPRAARLSKATDRARRVDTGPLQAQGLSGDEFATQLRKLRIAAMDAGQYPSSSNGNALE